MAVAHQLDHLAKALDEAGRVEPVTGGFSLRPGRIVASLPGAKRLHRDSRGVRQGSDRKESWAGQRTRLRMGRSTHHSGKLPPSCLAYRRITAPRLTLPFDA